MNYGQKLTKLKDSLGITYWSDYGKLMGLNGDWLAKQAKKDSLQIADIPKIIKIAEYHQISLDYLLRNDTEDITIDEKENLPNSDILKGINNIQDQLREKLVYFNGFTMSDDSKSIAIDSLEILKGLIKNNL
jgi:hypothetical protein